MVTVIVPVSGGKDSQVVLSLAIARYGVKSILCVHQNTGWDHPDTYAHMLYMEQFYGVHIHHTESKYAGMLDFLEKAKYFPSSASRGCTQRLKQEPFLNWLKKIGARPDTHIIWLGMRKEESRERSNKYAQINENDTFPLSLVSSFYSGHLEGDIPTALPIVDWDEIDVFSHLIREGAKRNPLYDRGHNRVGCYPCLIGRKEEWKLAGKDCIGRVHIKQLIELEEQWNIEGNPRKCIKVHPVWDVRNFLTEATDGLFPEFDENMCSWCNI